MGQKILLYLGLVFSILGCAQMHHVQLSDVDTNIVEQGRSFEILVSQTGVSTAEAGKVASSIAKSKQDQEAFKNIAAIIGLFQMGPRTGKQVYTDSYTDKIFSLLRKECPSGKISGLTSVRESANYPVVSGEIVRIMGYCSI